ncbi:MAG: hypothetical protein VW985_10880 [Gammaproteobacteria bacterium]
MDNPATARFPRRLLGGLWLVLGLVTGAVTAGECEPDNRAPAWLFCDDFDQPPDRDDYYSLGSSDGSFVWQADAGVAETGAMVARWHQGQVGAGGLQLLLGANPIATPTVGAESEKFSELYYRHYFFLQSGWRGNPHKLSRLTVLTDASWSQAMIAHLWGGKGGRLALDPVSCVGPGGKLRCVGYNDFKNMQWLGLHPGRTAVHTAEESGKWHCVETHVALNDEGLANGYQEFWLNDQREALAQGLDFVGDYSEFGLNGLFIENWWNGGAPGPSVRVLDNLVVSTVRIGCAINNG